MYTITGIVLLIGVIVGHTEAYRRARDPSTIHDQPKKVIQLPQTFGRFYCMNVNDNGAIFLTGTDGVEIYDKQGNHLNTIPNDQSSESHFEIYERYGSVVTKDQLLILEIAHTDKPGPDVTSINEYTFTGQLIGTKFTVDPFQVSVNTGRLGINGGKIIVNGQIVILINEDGSNPHRLEPPNEDDMPPMSPFYAHPERGVYTIEYGPVTKINIYDAASETVKDTITVPDAFGYTPNKIFADDDGRIYFIEPFRISIFDASGKMIKQTDYNDSDITDVDIGPDGTLYILDQYTGAILLY